MSIESPGPLLGTEFPAVLGLAGGRWQCPLQHPCHPSCHCPGWTGLEPGLPQEPVFEGWMVWPCVPETQQGQVTPWPGALPVWAEHGAPCVARGCLSSKVLLSRACGVRRGPEQLQEPQPGWQMSPELHHGAASSMGRDMGAQQKHCRQRFTPSQMQEGRKKKKTEKDWSTLESTERVTHGEERCVQEPQG